MRLPPKPIATHAPDILPRRGFLGLMTGIPPALMLARASAAQTARTTEVTAHGVTLTLDQPVEIAHSLDGVAYVRTPPEGLRILARTSPATQTDDGPVNGTVKNPVRGRSQGFDGRLRSYDPDLDAGFPIPAWPGDIVVCAVHRPGATASQRERRAGVLIRYAGFVFLETLPAGGTMAPALIGWAGRDLPAPYPVDLAAAVAELPRYSMAGIPAPRLDHLLARFDRLELGWGATASTHVETSYEALTTWSPTRTNYGRDMASWVGAVLLLLISDGLQDALRAQLLMRMISYGIQTYDPIAGSGGRLVADGGHHQFQFGPMLAALKWTGRAHLLDGFREVAGGNVLRQPFLHTEDTVAALTPHDDTQANNPANRAHIARRRKIMSVTGQIVELPTLVGNNLDPFHARFNGLELVRESDGAGAAIIGATDTSGRRPVRLELAAQPDPPFATDDVVYMRSQDPIRPGDADFRVIPTLAAVNPSFNSTYRAQNHWSEELLFAHAIGMWHPSFDAMQAYVIRANRPDDPAPGRSYPTHFTTPHGTDIRLAEQFWHAHAAQILPGLDPAAP